MVLKHHNHDYDGASPNIPKNTGDRYYTQDLGRDINYLRDQIGILAQKISGAMPFILSGGVITKGTGDTLNISSGDGYVKQSVTIPNDSTSVPASVMTADIEGVYVSWTTQANMAIASAVLDGSTVNYVKVQYAETNSSNRNRAKKAGAYPVEKIPSFTITVNMVAPTVYDICLAQFTGTTGGAFTITAGTTARGTLTFPKINEAVALTATATELNSIKTGWLPISGLSYASDKTITTATDLTEIISIGMKLKITQTTNKFFDVIAITSNLITVDAGTTYTVANAAITSSYYSMQENPLEWSGWWAYTPTFINLTIGNGSVTFFYKRISKGTYVIQFKILFGSTTSISGDVRMSLPITPVSDGILESIYLSDTGTMIYMGTARFVNNTLYIRVISKTATDHLTWSALSSTSPFTWTTDDFIDGFLEIKI